MKIWKISQAHILHGEDIFGNENNIMVFMGCTRDEIWKWAENHKKETEFYVTLWADIIECRERIDIIECREEIK